MSPRKGSCKVVEERMINGDFFERLFRWPSDSGHLTSRLRFLRNARGSLLAEMPTYKIRGVDVDFPFDAYDCQIVYMEKVIRSLQEGCNALLESPTGTGKTLCLLCATLAWRKTFGDFLTSANEERSNLSLSHSSGSQSAENGQINYPVIIYTSRTHSQLKQVIRELKTSNYRPKMAVLGSREQMCIHDEVRLLRGRAQNNACHYLCKKRLCPHQLGVSEYMKKHHELGNEPFDIEDLVNTGRTMGLCPYYISRELHKVVDILFAPYNYLIDPGNRRSLSGIDWNNAVLIFDEAHNLESICADAASFDLPSGYLTACISEAKQCVDVCIKRRVVEKSADKEFDPENYAILRALLLKLETRIAEVTIESRELGFTRPGDYIYEFLSDLNITYETANMLIDTIDNAALLLEEGNTSGAGTGIKMKGAVCRLESIRSMLNIIFRDGGKDHAKFYRESQPSITDSLKGKVSRTLSWWCFNPGLAMQQFERLGVRSIILTSGTLSPLDSFALELNLEFPVRLENPHVITPNQVWVGVVPSGPSSQPFNSSYKNRDSLEYKQELGNSIVNFARIVPDGLLVFFPSYYMMDQCIECWKGMGHASSSDFSTIWERICKYKQPIVEPKQSSLFPRAIEDFESKIRDNTTSGAIFFAVCRGKVSEGLDFADRAGRAVVVTGLPFSTKTDPKVRLKRDYLDHYATSQKKQSKVLTGEEWYVQQAARAVNQAVGRVIRHCHDYGAIVFCDERFAQQNWQCQMSYWLRPHIKCYPKFGDVVFTLTRFFRDKGFCDLKPKLAKSCTTEKSLGPLEKTLSLKSMTSLAPMTEHYSRKSLPSVLSTNTSSGFDHLEQIVPANRSSVSNELGFCSTLQRSVNHFCHNKRLPFKEGISKNIQYQDTVVVALTNDTSSSEQACEVAFAATSAKRPKTLELVDNVECQKDTDSKPADFGSSTNARLTQHVQVEKETFQQPTSHKEKHNSSIPCTDKTSGSAFLMQVQEKLTVAEYKEFVGFMKALKSKTMTITPLLESIAKLFSSPGRFSLLERFKDFVPAKYHPIYEQLLRVHGTNNDVIFIASKLFLMNQVSLYYAIGSCFIGDLLQLILCATRKSVGLELPTNLILLSIKCQCFFSLNILSREGVPLCCTADVQNN
ncbi:regulator of telomere elongation helicase [Musa troglodytarum]|uniref:Regulator of telomere elongation helicase 1 homolog n=1 Tax=Musa troglodytarum TaxID=320322 RepID=A0A9E7EHD4_9LILI|nr:regulator of telomere elongation helicase [Musa troglodytarum]